MLPTSSRNRWISHEHLHTCPCTFACLLAGLVPPASGYGIGSFFLLPFFSLLLCRTLGWCCLHLFEIDGFRMNVCTRVVARFAFLLARLDTQLQNLEVVICLPSHSSSCFCAAFMVVLPFLSCMSPHICSLPHPFATQLVAFHVMSSMDGCWSLFSLSYISWSRSSGYFLPFWADCIFDLHFPFWLHSSPASLGPESSPKIQFANFD